jgi:hypothetical protein
MAVPRVPVWRGLGVDRFAAIANGERRTLWGMQTAEAAKNLVKACIGRRGWNLLRAPLMRLRYAEPES